uniref:Transcription initiation factor TFIID subunit 12 n=1 Tax=Mycena chlorophos TaxID=658473 RepID=A0ABQ0LU27_MYCCL|nr:transcription initiation factor TFIID subunit 12 [Mycena chlorophos]
MAGGDKAKEEELTSKINQLLQSGTSTIENVIARLYTSIQQQKKDAASSSKPPLPAAPAPAPASAPGPVPIAVDEPPLPHPGFKGTTTDESPFLSAAPADSSAYPISQNLSVNNPTPVAYALSRPTLSGGHAMGRVAGTPIQYAREEPPPITFTTDHRTAQQPRKNTPGDLSMRRTIHDLVASVDPNVKIEPDVEDLLLTIADEFIDSVTNFACRLAKHRGGETLEVRDLQLHLERNHNIRIPGFAADDTRISLSQSSITPAAAPAGPAAKKATGGTHMTLRSQRLAQVQQAKREAKLM